MTEDEALEALEAAQKAGDVERAHIKGDEVVIEALRSLGWTRLAEAYDKASENWWYA